MRYLRRSRVLALVLSLSIVNSLIPPSVWAQAPTPEPQLTPPVAVRDSLFEGLRADPDGVYVRYFDYRDGSSIAHLYSERGGTFRKRIRFDVAEGVAQLHVTLSRYSDRGRIRLRLIDPLGAVVVPGRQQGNRYDALTPIAELVRQREQPGQRLADGQVVQPSLFGSQPVGTVAGDATSDALVDIRNPRPGRWTIVVSSEDTAGFLLSAGAIATDFGALHNDCCNQEDRAGCRSIMTLLLGGIKILVAAQLTIALFGLAGTAGATAVIAYSLVQAAVLIEDVLAELLVDNGVLSAKDANKLQWGHLIEGILAAGGLGTVITGNIATIIPGIIDSLGRNFVQAMAQMICEFFGEHEVIAFEPGFLPFGVENRDYSHTVGVITERKYTVTLKRGKLPPGLFLDKDGEIWGEPDTGSAGDYTFTLEADDRRDTVQREFALTIFGDGGGKGPDLVVFTFELQQELALPNEVVRTNLEIRNQGEGISQPGKYAIVWAPNRKYQKSGGLAVTGDVPALGPGESWRPDSTPSFHAPAQFTRGQRIFVGAIADFSKTTAEKRVSRGNAEKNNVEWVELTMRAQAPLRVLRPRQGDEIEPGSRVDIKWENDSRLRNVTIELWQNGRKDRRIFSGDTGGGNEGTWTVPDTLTGEGFTIQVTSKEDANAWAESGVFSIVPDQIDLSGSWDLTRTVTLFIEGSGLPVEIRSVAQFDHDVKRGELTISTEGEVIGTWDALDGILEATDIPGTIRSYTGNLLKHPGLVRIPENSGSYDDKSLDAIVEFVVDVGSGVGEATFTLEISARRR